MLQTFGGIGAEMGQRFEVNSPKCTSCVPDAQVIKSLPRLLQPNHMTGSRELNLPISSVMNSFLNRSLSFTGTFRELADGESGTALAHQVAIDFGLRDRDEAPLPAGCTSYFVRMILNNLLNIRHRRSLTMI